MTKQEVLNVLKKEQTQLTQARDNSENAMQYVKFNERLNEANTIVNYIAIYLDEPKAEPKIVEPKTEEPKAEKEKVRKS